MEEEFEDVAKFVKADEWKDTSSSEKLRIQTMLNDYKLVTEIGFDAPKPHFMKSEEEDKSEIDVVADLEKKFKRKCVVEYGMRKRIKLEETVAIGKRYPGRNIPVRKYVVEAEILDDRYVYCDECMHEHLDLCKEHILIPVHDNSVPVNKNSNRAGDTVPHGWVEVKESKINDGDYGIWALRKIPKGIQFGPYEGATSVDHTDGRYSWQIKEYGRAINYIDGFDTSISNWMRYVNCARNKEEQNLMAFQYRDKICYRSIVEIQPHTELLVFYGSKFAKEVGIDVKKYNSLPSTNAFPGIVFRCKNCYLIFCNPIYLEEHIARCTKKYVAKSDGRYRCKPCARIFFGKSEYDRHLNIEHHVSINPDERYPCPHCSAAFTIRSVYDKHMKSIHNDDGRTSKCAVCLKVFTCNSKFEIHKRMHTGEKPYECHFCNERFSIFDNLKKHTRMHTYREKPYGCDVCNERFSIFDNLREHTRMHARENHMGVMFATNDFVCNK